MMLDVSRYWYGTHYRIITLLLTPFSFLFHLCICLRHWMYRTGLLKTHSFTTPIIVVGNIVAGGSGKTPLVIWLTCFLKSLGFHPGIVSRGYGRSSTNTRFVHHDSSAEEVGDEAILLVRHTDCPVVIGVDRVAAVQMLLRQSNCDIIVSDDGLQHYRLGRTIEMAVIDGDRGFGNHYLLPAGPLRESISRLNSVDFVILKDAKKEFSYPSAFNMQVCPNGLVALTQQQKIKLQDFPHKQVHAVAGIGHPEHFFAMLKKAGFDIIPHVFPDHYRYTQKDFDFHDHLPIVMTEKDAVKCKSFANDRYWYLEIAVNLDEEFQKQLLLHLQTLERGNEHQTHLERPLSHNAYAAQHSDICD